MTTRRTLLLSPVLLAVVQAVAHASDEGGDISGKLRAIEATTGGRLGVCVEGASIPISYRGGERFPLCSTFKLLAAAAILKQVDAGSENLERRVVFDRAQVVAASPVTRERVGEPGMTLAEICEAAITRSDNTAGNLMLAAIGGTAELTRFAREIGDPVTRLDRIEPDLNEAVAGDPRDTTTPSAMATNLQVLLRGDILRPTSRNILIDWLVANKTGGSRLRAGLPEGWRVGDKTGTGENGATCDVAIVWPPSRAPLVVAAYLTETTASLDVRNAAFAAVASQLVKSF